MSPFLLCPSDTGGERVSVQRSANSRQQDKEKTRLFYWFNRLDQLRWFRTKKSTKPIRLFIQCPLFSLKAERLPGPAHSET